MVACSGTYSVTVDTVSLESPMNITVMLIMQLNVDDFDSLIEPILLQYMSQLNIQRKRTENIRVKLHSQQSRNLRPRQSLGRILNDSIAKRRNTTQNSPQHYQESSPMLAQIEEAKQVYKNKNTKNALAMFRKLYKKYPNNSQIPYYIGSCLLNEGGFESALIYFRVCLSNDPNFNKNIFIYMAICYKAQGKFKQAADVLQKALEKYPRFKEGHFYKGKIHMKLNQFQQAIQQFRKCVKLGAKDSELSHLFLGDCLRALKRNQQAIEQYNKLLVQQNSQYFSRAIVKKIGTLIEYKKFKQAYKSIRNGSKNIESAELTFFKGLCQYQFGNYNDAITFFELSLTSSIPQPLISVALRMLIQITIILKDFFGAEHLISRSKLMSINQTEMTMYYQLVEGINDLIKKRMAESEQKLSNVYRNSQKQKQDYQKFLCQASSPYYAYCLFSAEKYQQALEVYKNYLNSNRQGKKLEQYNKLICEGVLLHKNNQFQEAEQKFRQASDLIPKKTQPIFLICINIIQNNREGLSDQKVRSHVFNRIGKQFRIIEQAVPQNSLFLFYYSLVLLYQGEDACHIIDQAIRCSEEQVSQYFFIQALSYSLAGRTLQGLQMITKAIQLDQNIPEFYKERSKYYYVLERYEQAVTDSVRVLDQANDEEAKLLLTFYYYMTNQFRLSLDLLEEVSGQCSEDKFKEFQMALQFRTHQFDKCGVAGTLINAIHKQQKLSEDFLNRKMKTCIEQRQSYSQFTIYHLHLFMSAYYFYNDQFDKSLQHLFGSLEEIQVNSQGDQQYASLSEQMLNQIKFNIAIASLMKQTKQSQPQQNSLEDTCRYIQMFIKETENSHFIKTMYAILRAIDPKKRKPSLSNNQQKQTPQYIELQPEIIKLSKLFPEVQITLKQNKRIKTKFMMLYPQKLKFNINPEFDQSFLFNFDLDKVQSKLCPPWFKLHEGQIFFTDKIRNQSVLISETDRAPTPSLILAPSPVPQNLRQKFKLDEEVEKRLQKLIQGRNKKTPNLNHSQKRLNKN